MNTSWAAPSAPRGAWTADSAPVASAVASTATSVTTSYATTVVDTFAGAATGSDLTLHVADSGAEWTRNAVLAGAFVASSANRVYVPTSTAMYIALGVPPSSDYTVSATLRALSSFTDTYAGVAGRMQTAANTAYFARYEGSAGANGACWALYKAVAGSTALLGTAAEGLSTNSDYVLRLVLAGTSIKFVVNDVTKVSATDSAITLAGYGGLRATVVVTQTDSTGLHLADFSVRGFVGETSVSVTTAAAWSAATLRPASWSTRT